MSSCNIRIERLVNGYTIEMTDPELVKKNNKRDTKGASSCAPWVDPNVTLMFETAEEIIKFLTDNIEKVLPSDEFETSFTRALKEEVD